MKHLIIAMLNNVLTLTHGWKFAGSANHKAPLLGRKDYDYSLLIELGKSSDGQDLFIVSLFDKNAITVSRDNPGSPLKVIRTDSWTTVEDIVEGWVGSKADPDASSFEALVQSYHQELEPA